MANLSTVVLALGGYMFTYYNAKVNKEREEQIERVNAQLRSLYGPLLACVTSSQSAYASMLKQHSPDGTRQALLLAIQGDPAGKEGQAYRGWMTQVLQPLNERVAELVIKNADLLESHTMEPLLLQLVAHVSAYRVIIKRWTEGHVEEWSQISFPDQLLPWAEKEFSKMKDKQAMLLGVRKNKIPTLPTAVPSLPALSDVMPAGKAIIPAAVSKL